MYLTYLDSNSWLIEIAAQKILLDPWLVGDLVFGNAPWFFRGEKLEKRTIPEDIDLILLSQGLEDHAHPPTLKQLDRNIPVVGSPTAAKVVKELGYATVTALEHQQKFTLKDTVEIKAVPGSPIGPQLVENGYIVKNLATGHSLYYEPHGYHCESLKEDAPVDVVIAPIISIKLFQFLPFIKGQKNALEACQLLQPQVILPTAAGGDVKFDGILTSVLSMDGTLADLRTLLNKNNLSTEVIEPKPGERFAVELKERAVI